MGSVTRDGADAAASALVMAPPSGKPSALPRGDERHHAAHPHPHDGDSASEESAVSEDDKVAELIARRPGGLSGLAASVGGGSVSEISPPPPKPAGIRRKSTGEKTAANGKRKLSAKPSAAGNKAARVHGLASGPRPISVLRADSSEDEEVAELLLGMGARPFVTSVPATPTAAELSAAASRVSSPTKKSEPPPLPAGASPARPAASKRKGGSSGGLETIGRCKCGKKISAAHPACKSELMLLCEKFQTVFGRPGAEEIQLNEAAVKLNVARRRLYDIINVLEAVEIISRTGKLTYVWRGMDHLPSLLTRLVEEENAGTPAVRARKGQGKAGGSTEPSDKPLTFSLWMLSRHFVRLLLSSAEPIPLADVSSMLVGEDAPRRAQTMVTVERRLYDIGSILSSIGLIKKTYVGHRQPAFCWSGESGVPQPSIPSATATPKPESSTREPAIAPKEDSLVSTQPVANPASVTPIQPKVVKPEAVKVAQLTPETPNVPLMTANLSSLASSLSMASAAASMWPSLTASGAMMAPPLQLGLPPLPAGLPLPSWQGIPLAGWLAQPQLQPHFAFAPAAQLPATSGPGQLQPNGSLPMAIQCAPLALRSDLPPSIMLPGVSAGTAIGPLPPAHNLAGQAPPSVPAHWYLNGSHAYSVCK